MCVYVTIGPRQMVTRRDRGQSHPHENPHTTFILQRSREREIDTRERERETHFPQSFGLHYDPCYWAIEREESSSSGTSYIREGEESGHWDIRL